MIISSMALGFLYTAITSFSTHPSRSPCLARRTLLRPAFLGAALAISATRIVHADSTCAASATMTLATLPTIRDIDGNNLDMSQLQGNVLFVMNVASACGYTGSGYSLLKELTDKYDGRGFKAVIVPCNSFGMQENGSPEEIKAFALARADKVVITERSEVNGANAHPLIKLAQKKFPQKIGWNFDGKYVFDRDGNPVARFGNGDSDAVVSAEIEKYL